MRPALSPPQPPPTPLQDTFIFRVEGTGVLRPEDIVLTACEVLARKIRNIQVCCGGCRVLAARSATFRLGGGVGVAIRQ
jgi:hypothetical protein